jgi:putative hydrolase of the HAD superfamily
VSFEWVLFDADGVMQRVRDGWLGALTAHGGDRGEEFVLAVFEAERASVAGGDFAAAMREVLQRFAITTPLADVLTSQNWIDVDPGMVAAVAELRRQGIRSGLATNQQSLRGEYMRGSLGFGDVFDEQFYSWELGFAKPDAGYFEAIIDRVQVSPNRVLFIDDREDNVEGARSAGLTAELFPRDGGVASLRPILARHGITL